MAKGTALGAKLMLHGVIKLLCDAAEECAVLHSLITESQNCRMVWGERELKDLRVPTPMGRGAEPFQGC